MITDAASVKAMKPILIGLPLAFGVEPDDAAGFVGDSSSPQAASSAADEPASANAVPRRNASRRVMGRVPRGSNSSVTS
jgi:hypothetical protein